MHTVRKVREQLRGRQLAVAALLCVLLAAVTVAVEPPGRLAGAASDQSGGSQDPPPAPTTSAAAEISVGSLSRLRASLVGGLVSVTWDDPGNDAISKYQYQIKTMGAGGAYGAWTDVPGSGASTIIHTIAVTGSERRNVRVRAVNATGASLYYGVASTDVSDAPSGLRASLSGGSVSLSWDDPGDDFIDSYWYRIRKAGAGNAYSALTEIADSDDSTTSATISVTGAGRRIVELQARPAVHPGWGAIYKSAVASTGPPDAPSTLRASLSGSAVSLSWDNPSDAAITKYQYRIKTMGVDSDYGVWTDISNSGASTVSYAIATTGSGRRNVQVRAVNAEGSGSHAVASTGVPAVPLGLKAVMVSGGSVVLNWDDPGDDSIASYQYRIRNISTKSAYGNWTDIGGSNASTTGHTLTVTGSGRRVVQLRARNGGGFGSPASASNGPPAQMSGFTTPGGQAWGVEDETSGLNAAATSTKRTIVVNWVAPGDDSIIKYQYSFRAQSIRARGYHRPVDLPGSGPSTTSHTFVLPTPEMYRVVMWAVNSAGPGRSVNINMRPVWPALAAPSGLSASLSGSSVSLNWDNPFDGSIYKYQYRIKKVGTASAYSSWTDISGSNADTTSATITVTGSERRIVQLRALRRSLGDPSSPAMASTGLPAVPSGFASPGGSSSGSGSGIVLTAATSSSKGSVGVSWSAPGDDSILKYQYQFKAPNVLEDSQWIDIPGSEASTTTHTFVFPTPDMYRIRLRAVNSAGAASQTFNVKPSWPALAAPSGLRAVLNGSSVTLSWNNPFDHSIEKYQYRIKTVGAGNVYGSWTDIAGSKRSTTSHTISVTGSAQRDVQLRALRYDQVGGLGASATALTTAPPATPAPTPLLAPDRPSGLKASGGNGVIDLFWSNPGDATITGYQYRIRLSSERSYGEWQSIPSSGASTVSYTIPSLAAKQGYVIRLRAGNAAGWSHYMSMHASTNVTHSPTGMTAAAGDGSFTLTWDAPLTRYGITGYRYGYTRLADPKSWTGWLSLPGSARSHTVTGLTNGSRYEIWLKAVSAAGESSSRWVRVTPTSTTSPSSSGEDPDSGPGPGAVNPLSTTAPSG